MSQKLCTGGTGRVSYTKNSNKVLKNYGINIAFFAYSNEKSENDKKIPLAILCPNCTLLSKKK